VKLGKNVNDTYVVLSKTYGGQAMRKSSVFERYKQFEESLHVEITNGDNAHHISRVLFTLNSFHKAKQSPKLIMWKY